MSIFQPEPCLPPWAGQGSVAEFILSDSGNDNQQFIRKYTQDANGNVTSINDFDFDGVPYVPVGPVIEYPHPYETSFLDPLNTQVITAAEASPGVPWVGGWTITEAEGVVRNVTVLAATDTSLGGLGGVFTFQYSEDGVTPTISESRVIGDFEEVRAFDLLNYGAFYRVMFEPDRPLAADSVFLTTRHYREYSGAFVRLAEQRIEQSNAALPATFAFLQAFDPVTGKSVNVPPPPVSGTDPVNQLTVPLLANEVWEGTWLDVESHGNLIFLYAITPETETPAQVQIQYSDDQATVLSTTNLSFTLVAGGPFTYAVYLSIVNGNYAGKFARPRVVNGPVAQTAAPVTLFARNQFPFTGSFAGLDSPLTFFSQALLTRSVLAGEDPAAGFNNVGADRENNLFVQDRRLTISQSGSQFFEGVRDDISLVFSRDSGVAAIASLVDGGGGAAAPAHDPAEGQAVFAVTATPNEICFYLSDLTIRYESGHMIRIGQTIEPSAIPTGDGKIIWGVGESDGAGNIVNAIGYELAADGLHAIRIKAGVYAYRQAQADFNRDTVMGQVGSQYTVGGVPVALDPLNNGIYEKQFEWYGAAPPTSLTTSPYGQPIILDIEETVGQIMGTTVPEPNLPMFIYVRGDSVAGQALSVRTGSWRGGILTNKTVLTGQGPDGVFVNQRESGSITLVPTPALLAPGATYTSNWFPLDGYELLGVLVKTDQVSATDGIEIEFSDDMMLVDSHAVRTMSATDALKGSKHFYAPRQGDFGRIVYTNGGVAQTIFEIHVTAITEPGQATDTVEGTLSSTSTATMSRSIPVMLDPATGLYANVTRSTTDGSDRTGEHVAVVKHEVATPILELDSWVVGRASVLSSTIPVKLIAAPTAGRKTFVVKAITTNTKTAFIGPTSAQALNGYELAAGESVVLELGPGADVWGVGSTAAQVDFCWIEVVGDLA